MRVSAHRVLSEGVAVNAEHVLDAHVDGIIVHQPADGMRILGISGKIGLSRAMPCERHFDTEPGAEIRRRLA